MINWEDIINGLDVDDKTDLEGTLTKVVHDTYILTTPFGRVFELQSNTKLVNYGNMTMSEAIKKVNKKS